MTRVLKNISYVLHTPDNDNDGHLGGINSLKYNNCTATLFSAGRDGTVKLWKNEDRIMASVATSEPDFSSINNTNSIDANNQLLASENAKINKAGIDLFSSEAQSEKPYSLIDSQQLHTDWINDIELIDNNSLVSCSSDLLVKHWNFNDGTQSTFGYHTDYAQCLASPNSSFRDFKSTGGVPTWFASGGLDKKINTWDLTKCTKVNTYFPVKETSGSSNLNFYNHQDKGSIYSMSATENLIAAGGTENSISLIDRRTPARNILKLVGHTDTVRALSISNEWLLSGSADSTIKLWSLKNNRVFRTFDMHNSSIWSLYSNYEDYRIFYSGDKNGFIYKTDLRGCHISPLNEDLNDVDDSDNEIMGAKLNENLGIITLLAKELYGVNSLVAEEGKSRANDLDDNGGYVWSATKNNTLNNFLNPNLKSIVLHQFLNIKNNLLTVIQNRKFENDIPTADDSESTSGHNSFVRVSQNNEELYDLVSQLSIDNPRKSIDNMHRTTSIASMSMLDNLDNLDNLSDTMSLDDGGLSSADEDQTQLSNMGLSFETSFIKFNGIPSTQYINANTSKEFEEHAEHRKTFEVEILADPAPENLITVVPVNEISNYSIKGNPSITKVRILNDRRTIVTLNDKGTVHIWNIVTGKIKNTFVDNESSSELQDDMDEDEYERHLSDKYEHLFESVIENVQTKETLPNWCHVSVKIGKVFITISENTFTNCEIYVDELKDVVDSELIKKIKGENSNPMDEVRLNLGKMVLKSLLYNFLQEVIVQDQIFRQHILDEDIDFKKLVAREKYARFHDDTSSNSAKLSNRDNDKQQKGSDISVASGDNKDNAFKKFARFGRKSKQEKEKEKDREKEQASTSTASVGSSKKREDSLLKDKVIHDDLNSTASCSTDKISCSSYEETTLALLDRIEYGYIKADDRKEVTESDLKLPGEKEIPLITLLVESPIIVLINESSSHLKGNSLNLYKFYTNDSGFTAAGSNKETYSKLKRYLPLWVGNALLKNQYIEKPVNKINFIIEEWKPDSTSSSISGKSATIVDDKNAGRKKMLSIMGPNIDSTNGFSANKLKLPPLVGSNYRLSAYQMIRVKKIMFYILEKFQYRTPEMKKMYPYANIKFENSIKVEEWLEILCNNEILPSDMTLLTVKTKIWKSSGDIVLKYRRKVM